MATLIPRPSFARYRQEGGRRENASFPSALVPPIYNDVHAKEGAEGHYADKVRQASKVKLREKIDLRENLENLKILRTSYELWPLGR